MPCHVPYGSYPGNMPYEYFSDEEHLAEWMQAEQDPDTFQEFLDKYIYGVSDFREYLELKGGESRMAELRELEPLRRNWRKAHACERRKPMKSNNNRYNLMELMVCVAARQLEDSKTAVIGTGECRWPPQCLLKRPPRQT